MREVRLMVPKVKRSTGNKLLLGVAGGLAEYFHIDPLFVRLGFIGMTFLNGLGVALYLALAVLMPREDAAADDPMRAVRQNVRTLPGEVRTAGRKVVRLLRGTEGMGKGPDLGDGQGHVTAEGPREETR